MKILLIHANKNWVAPGSWTTTLFRLSLFKRYPLCDMLKERQGVDFFN